MKKTIPTNIAQTLFYIEEDSYPKLENYLREVKKYFASYEDHIEIIQDIESRISEQLIEYSDTDKTNRIITGAHIDHLIESMGWPEEFGESNETADIAHEPHSTIRKKFYRDSENKTIAGVASGIGQYFGIDPIIVRVIFFIGIFFHGLGILAYLLLWIVTPEAITATQKLEMQGEPVTLDELKKIIQEKSKDIADKKNIRTGGKAFLENSIAWISQVAQKSLNLIGKIAGVGLKIFSIFAAMSLIIMLGIAISNPMHSLMQSALSIFSSLPLLYLALIAVFIVLFIPLLFIHALGNLFLNIKPFPNRSLPAILGGVWILTCIISTVLFSTVAMRYQSRIESSPAYQETTLTPAVSDFSKLIIENGQNVTITKGETTTVEIHGMARDVALISVVSADGTLTIKRDRDYDFCFFCNAPHPAITITTPSLTLLSVADASRVSLSGDISDLHIQAKNSSSVTLTGSGDSLETTLANASRLNAQHFIVSNANLILANASRALVNAKTTLSGSLTNASSLIQYGTALTDNIKTTNDSHIQADTLTD